MTYQLWLTDTPTRLRYKPRVVARPWQPRIEPTVTVIFDVPALSLKMRKPSRRNQRRLFDAQFGGPKAATLPGYPKTASREPHWADTTWAGEDDARRARNALRRRRQGR